MSDLLTRIIQRATRPTTGIVPVVPSLYERASLAALQARPEASPRDTSSGGVVAAEPARIIGRMSRRDVPEQPAGQGMDEPSRTSNAENAAAKFGSVPPVLSLRPPDAPAAPEREPIPRVGRPLETAEAPSAMDVARHEEPVTPGPALARGVRPQIGAESLRARRHADPAGNPPEQPVEVHVSIGHIEIRQLAPPAPPPARPAPLPHLRLDEYLKRRRGEGR